MTKVFISSTVYDLLDLRAELEAHIRDLGLIPVLSDLKSSGFDTPGEADSIETCLANVRNCDVFVCILSQRYGGSLKGAGYEDISATHLEYKEARKHDKRILMYVRDRTAGEFDFWRKAQNAKGPKGLENLRWVRTNDHKLFSLLHEHSQLECGGQDNWYWSYQSSVDLKQRLTQDLSSSSGRSILQRLINEGRVPVFIVNGKRMKKVRPPIVEVQYAVENISNTVALEVFVRIKTGEESQRLPSIRPNESRTLKLSETPTLSSQHLHGETIPQRCKPLVHDDGERRSCDEFPRQNAWFQPSVRRQAA